MCRKALILVIIFFFICAATYSQAPLINSFSPLSGSVGSQVVISGSGFSSTPASNIVNIGGVNANVIASSPTNITAEVPAASVYQPISVTVNNLTAFSRQPFTTTFINGSLANSSFILPETSTAIRNTCFSDFNNDGLLDMAGIASSNKLNLYKNTGSPTHVQYEPGPVYTLGTDPMQVMATDLDGDGKADLAVIASNATYATLYRNTTTGSAITFDNPVYYTFGVDNYPYSIAANDVDGDGKTDLVVGYVSSGYAFSVARNTGSPGILTFAAKVNFNFGTVPGGSGNVGADNKIYLSDIDGDNKPDVTSMSRFFPPYLIYRNTSTSGAISFATKVAITSNRDISIGNGYFDAAIADLDGDTKPEITYSSSDSNQVSVYRNTSTIGNISYTSKINFPAAYVPIAVTVNDIDGDGLVDIGMLSYDSVVVFKNAGSPGNIAFSLKRKYEAGYALQYITTADADADGKPEIVISGMDVNNNNANETKILLNKVGEDIEDEICPPAASLVFISNKTGSTYQWQLDAGSGFTDITDNSIYSGSNTQTLDLNNIPATFYGYAYRCRVDGNIYSEKHILKVVNRWTGNFSSAWENPGNWSCGVVPEMNTDVIINFGSVTVQSNVTVRSMTVKPSVNVTVATGGALNMLH